MADTQSCPNGSTCMLPLTTDERAQQLWGKVKASVLSAWGKVDHVLAGWLGLDESKYQVYIDTLTIQEMQEREAREMELQAAEAAIGASGDFARPSIEDVESQIQGLDSAEHTPLNSPKHGIETMVR